MIYCGTGHRPNKLYLGYENPNLSLRLQLKVALSFLRSHNPTKIISGMAIGWDTAWGMAAVVMKLPLVAAIPFLGQEKLWKPEDQERWRKLYKYAGQTGGIKIVSPGGFTKAKFQTRNIWMVDNSEEVVALHDGTTGGTYNCVEYAINAKKHVNNLWEEYELLISTYKNSHT